MEMCVNRDDGEAHVWVLDYWGKRCQNCHVADQSGAWATPPDCCRRAAAGGAARVVAGGAWGPRAATRKKIKKK
ncbi:uncharacterized protein G2W53_003766 [Senna tora]|uniref:Uncharacterized protein n=1 Tax=Senna tora TaxID=362788 RepID=A0A834XE40_9FABA|nr:uncharacterized protein G2W53_003766 [Senna tora]